MASVPALGGIATRGVPAGCRGVRGASAAAATQGGGGDGRPARAAYAESAHANESANPARDQRYHGNDRTGHRRCDSRGRARSGSIGKVARSTYSSLYGDHSEVAGGRLATGASV